MFWTGNTEANSDRLTQILDAFEAGELTSLYVILTDAFAGIGRNDGLTHYSKIQKIVQKICRGT